MWNLPIERQSKGVGYEVGWVKEIEPVIVERPVVGVKKVFTDEPVVQKIEKDTTKGLFVTGGWNGTILTSTQVALKYRVSI